MYRTAILAAIFFSALQTYAIDNEPIGQIEFVGWSKDGNIIAYIQDYGDDGFITHQRWSIRIGYVVDLANNKKMESYKIEQKGSLKVINNGIMKLYDSSKVINEWAALLKQHKFNRPSSNPHSPSGKWQINMVVNAKPVYIETNLDTLKKSLLSEIKENESKPTVISSKNIGDMYDCIYPFFRGGDIITKYVIKGILEELVEGKWFVEICIQSAKNSIRLLHEELSYIKGEAKGKYYGEFAAFWSPDEKSVVVVRSWGPIAGGGGWSDIYFSKLP